MGDRTCHIHPQALVESRQIGAGTHIWAFAHVLKGARIGCNCNIGDHCYIENGVRYITIIMKRHAFQFFVVHSKNVTHA